MEPISSTTTKEKSIRNLKICRQCCRKLPLDQFYLDGDRPYAHCKACHTWYVTRWMKKNPDKVKATKKRYYDKRKSQASDKPIPADRDCFRVEPQRALDCLKRAAQEAAESSEFIDAEEGLSKPMFYNFD